MTDRPIIFSGPMVRALLDGRKTQTRRLLRAEVPPSPAMDEIHPANKAKHPAPYLDAYCGERKTEANPRGMGPNWCWWTRDDRPGREFRVGLVPGDRLWVRENAAVRYSSWHHVDGHRHSVDYAADYDGGRFIGIGGTGGGIRAGEAPTVFPSRSHNKDQSLRWCPSIHMPRWASRLTLTVTDVRVRRLLDITEEDAIAEGFVSGQLDDGFGPRDAGDGWTIESAGTFASAAGMFQLTWQKLNPDWDGYDSPWIAAVSFSVEHGNIDALPKKELAA